MIALRASSLPIETKGPTSPKAPAPPNSLPAQAVNPDFSAWVAKALAALPDPGTDAKSSKEKSDAKSNFSNSANDASDQAAANLANLGVDQQAPLPALPPAKAGGHASASSRHAIAGVETGKSEFTSQPPTPEGTAKTSAPLRATIKPQIPEVAPRPAEMTPAKAASKSDGMAAAQSDGRMNSGAQENKIAEQASQKLPPVSAISSAAAIKADSASGKVRLPVDFSTKDNATEQVSLTTAKSAAVSSPVIATAVSAVQAPSTVNRVEEMIAREAVTFKRSGADEIGVSLKIDAQTQLFLQLSYRDGQTQATLRCEKGDLPALSAHFGQLQESLAKQNIQLQGSANNFDLDRQGSSGRSWQDSSESQTPNLKDEAKSTPSTKTNSRTPAQRGWESWA